MILPSPSLANNLDLDGAIASSAPAHVPTGGENLAWFLETLRHVFAEPFSIVHVESGNLIHADFDGLSCDLFGRIELLAEVARSGRPEIVEDVAPLSMLAIPLPSAIFGEHLVAIGIFVSHSVDQLEDISAAAATLGIDASRALKWTADRNVWSARVLMRLAELVIRDMNQRQQLKRLGQEADDAVAHANDVDVELNLLHRLTGNLLITDNATELWHKALAWLAEAVPAQCFVIVPDPQAEKPVDAGVEQQEAVILGECPTSVETIDEVIHQCRNRALRQPLTVNRAESSLATWPCPTIRELVCVPVRDGASVAAWLLAINHKGGADELFSQFGSVEARLLGSVSTMLGIHSSNIRLYRQQSNLFASSVRALTSAIDAKDEYTLGHSDRVARVSVSIANQLGLDKETCNTLYLAGLLHDIGKIGIDDQVLNKPSKLTDEEYEHIKMHPQLGYDILKGVQQLKNILPSVLHHHEAWDGGGYPDGLRGEETPLLARIMAVADAFDAMSNDRPYRKGMPDEKLDAILREGAGSQWDPKVVEAFFEIRDEIRRIARSESEPTIVEESLCVN